MYTHVPVDIVQAGHLNRAEITCVFPVSNDALVELRKNPISSGGLLRKQRFQTLRDSLLSRRTCRGAGWISWLELGTLGV